MNPRDLPEAVAKLSSEMHEVRSELSVLNGRIDRLDRRAENLETEMQLTREENRENTDRLLNGFQRMFDPFLNRLLEHDDQLRKHASRLNNLEAPQQ